MTVFEEVCEDDFGVEFEGAFSGVLLGPGVDLEAKDNRFCLELEVPEVEFDVGWLVCIGVDFALATRGVTVLETAVGVSFETPVEFSFDAIDLRVLVWVGDDLELEAAAVVFFAVGLVVGLTLILLGLFFGTATTGSSSEEELTVSAGESLTESFFSLSFSSSSSETIVERRAARVRPLDFVGVSELFIPDVFGSAASPESES